MSYVTDNTSMRLTFGGGNPSMGRLAPSIGLAGENDDGCLALFDEGEGPWPSSAISDMYCNVHTVVAVVIVVVVVAAI